MSIKTDALSCDVCCDTGVVFVGCCSGNMCGCMGYPVLAKGCKCEKEVCESKMSEQEVLIFNNVEWVG